MSKFFEFVSANLRLAGNLMISPSERFHAGQMTTTVADLAYEGLRGVTDTIDAASQSVSKKARQSKSLWASFCDFINVESISFDCFGYMTAPSERTCVAGQMLSSRVEPKKAEASVKAEQVVLPQSAAKSDIPSVWQTLCESNDYAEQAVVPNSAAKSAKRSSLWANLGLMVGPNALNSVVAMREFAKSPVLEQIREDSHSLSQAKREARKAKAAERLPQERLADILMNGSLSPADRLVNFQLSEASAAEAKANAFIAASKGAAAENSYARLADILMNGALSPVDRLVEAQLTKHEAVKAQESKAAAERVADILVESAQHQAAAGENSYARLAEVLMNASLSPADRLVEAQLTKHEAIKVEERKAAAEPVAAERVADILVETAEHKRAVGEMPQERLAAIFIENMQRPALVAANEVATEVAPTADTAENPEVLSSYALATLAAKQNLTDAELTSLYLKQFKWLDPTQSMLMAHLARALQESDKQTPESEETQAYVASRWDGIVSALTEDSPKALAALPHKAPAKPAAHGILASLKRITASESKIQAAQVTAGHRLPGMN